MLRPGNCTAKRGEFDICILGGNTEIRINKPSLVNTEKYVAEPKMEWKKLVPLASKRTQLPV